MLIAYWEQKEIRPAKETAVALGCFDGVHIGHQKVLSACVDEAQKKGLLPAAFSFLTPPRVSMTGDDTPIVLNTPEEKADLLAECGIEYLLYADFRGSIRDMSEEDFVSIVLDSQMRARTVICGENFTFGKGGAGNVAKLKKLCEERGIETLILPIVRVDGIPVSSTAIRRSLREGNRELASRLTGRES